MTRRRVRFTATAREHVRRLKEWWDGNSPRPEIVQRDLEEAINILSVLPGIGSPYPSSPIAGVRRLYLERLTSHLYYITPSTITSLLLGPYGTRDGDRDRTWAPPANARRQARLEAEAKRKL